MRIVTLGEGMIEIAGRIGTAGVITYGGDVLNVTVALARLGHAPALLTALGTDPWSDELLAAWQGEGVDTGLVARHPDRVPGLYAIRVDADGERSFTYWRDRSAARDLFALPQAGALMARAGEADVLVLSGITLSLYDASGRARIAEAADRVRARGGTVAFDGNYRARGWAGPREAESAFADFAPHATLGLPTADDEAELHGRAAPGAVAARWHAAGVREVVVKLGAEGAFVSSPDGAELVPTRPVAPIDTSGAGDAFDAGYIAARLAGRSPAAAARFGHVLAGATIRHRGAIPPRDAVIHLRPDTAA